MPNGWQAICQRLPIIEKVMSLNTFKQQVPIILDVIQKMDNMPQQYDPPKKFRGWNVHKDRKGFIRIVKRVDGKSLKSIYIGKTWDPGKADQKIDGCLANKT